MSLSLALSSDKIKPHADTIVFGVFTKEKIEQHPFFRFLTPANQRYLKTFIQKGFLNEKDEVDFVVFPSGKPSRAFLLGLGDRKHWSLQNFMLLSRKLVSIAATQKVGSLALHIPSLAVPNFAEDVHVRRSTENFLLADYRFGKFKKNPDKGKHLRLIELIAEKNAMNAKALRAGKIVGSYTSVCRDLANMPAGHLTPKAFADEAKTLATKTGCSFRVLGREAMQKEKMGAILGVAQGSIQEPQLVVMEYSGGKKGEAPIAFVGKGVTFDSGGINLKPSVSMSDMHMDMSGGAAAVSAIAAIAELKLPINVVALVPAVENMPSGSGYHPGDVLVSRNGTTIEVGDTDAEGRIILADALDYAKTFKPKLIIDLATLTGAAVVALGAHYIGMFTSSDKLADELLVLGEQTGDVAWRLPMGEEYEAEIKGSIADISNIGKTRYGGASHGAVFLKHFVGNVPWAHLDLATMTSTDGQFLSKGATGTGVRLLVALAQVSSNQ